jgi:hypothetical protein
MPQNLPALPIVMILGVLAGSAAAQGRGGDHPAQSNVLQGLATQSDPGAIVAQAAAAIQARTAVSANLRFRATLRGATMLGSGAYWQQGRGPKRVARLELRMQIGDQTSTLTQVCDGLHLWTHRTLAGKSTLTRIDLQRAAREAGARDMGDGPPLLPPAGGLPQILVGLAEQFEFRGLEQTSVQAIPMWMLSGTWSRARLRELLPQQADEVGQGRGADFERLAPHVPDRVELVLGQDDLFPYRIEYSREGEEGARQTLVALEFFNVRIGEPVDARQFIYRPPPDLEIVDVTDEFLKRGQPGQGRAAP